ncbi:MAG: helix-turn-helix domain-containing protein [Faecalibacterium sp.]
MEFNRIIKLLRKERGITQKQAAEELGVSQALLSHYEKGIRECGLDFVVRVADYYNVSCDYLLGRSAERNGMMLSAEDLPSPDRMKDNVYHGSVLPTMNKKLISNSLNVLYAKIGQCHNKALTGEVSAYLMMAVTKMFRLLYSAEPHNAPGLFSVEEKRWPGYSDAVMKISEANVEALLAGESVNGQPGMEDPSPLAMTTESLSREFPLYTPSLLNLVKTSETRARGLSAER